MDCLPQDGRLINISEAIYIPIAILCAVAIVITSLMIAINIRFRNYKLLKMTSPNLNIVMLVGAVFLCLSVLLNGATSFLGDKPTKKAISITWRVVQSSLWFLCVGFTLFFAPLAAKTWRVHKIFTDAAVKGRVIKDDRLLCIVAAMVVVDLVFLGLWYILDTPECKLILYGNAPGFLSVVDINSNLPSISVPPDPTISPVSQKVEFDRYISMCVSAYTPVWAVTVVAYKAVLVFYVIYVSWATRFVTFPSMKDSSGIIISCFVTLIMFCSGLPFIISLTRWPSVQFGIYAAVVLISTFIFLFFHYTPKILLLKKYRKDDVITRGFSQYTTPQKKEFTDEEIRDLVVQNTSLRKELQDKQRKYKHLLEQHRLAKAKLLKYTFGKESETIPNGNAKSDESRKEEESNISSTENSESKVSADSPATISKTPSPNSQEESKIEIEESSEDVVDGSLKVTQKDVSKPKLGDKTRDNQTSPSRRVSFHPEVSKRNDKSRDIPDNRRHTVNEFSDLPNRNNVHHHHHNKKFVPSLGKKGWDYYTRGTGYLRYKENVLNHNIENLSIPNPQAEEVGTDHQHRIVARKSEAYTGHESKQSTHSAHVHSSSNEPSKYVNKKNDFKYYSTSAASRSPSITSNVKNNNDGSKHKDDSTGNELPSESSTLSVRTREKRPVTGHNNVIVKTCQTPDILHRIEFDFTSGSDSDDYDESTTSMDSISCELFPPLSYRHKHYLRHYDLMHAKYIAHREKQRKRQKKNAIYYLEKSEGYSSDAENTMNKTEEGEPRSPTPHKLQMGTKKPDSALLRHRLDERFMYDSITSSDSDSGSSFSESYLHYKRQNKGIIGNPHSSTKSPEVTSYQVHRPMPLSTTKTKGIFV